MFKDLSFVKYRKYQRIIIAAVCVALASQINFAAVAPGFIIALSTFFLPIFLYFNQDLNPLQLGCAIALASPLFRGCLLLLTNNSNYVFNYTFAEIIFFLTYTIIYYVLYWRTNFHNNTIFFFTIVICDYVSNIVEVGILTNWHGYTLYLLQLICLVAIIRSTLAFLLAALVHYFQLLIVKSEDHEQQYYHFIWVASAVKSEVYFMKKSINDIEEVTKNAYLLNEQLKTAHLPEEQQKAYQIAQRVHEIKHSYQNVIKGLGDYFDDQTNAPMQMADILKIVSNYTQMIIHNRHLGINLVIKNEVDCRVPKHYYLITILSNLILNSIDAIGSRKNGEIIIQINANSKNIQLTVTDNGSGIPREIIPIIFKPGFSTKFDQTGDIYRGIGLSNVVTIVHEQFEGSITVNSQAGVGTSFIVNLNKARLTGQEGVKE